MLLKVKNDMKKILITGKDSYIGRSVKNWLLKNENDYFVEELDLKNGSWKNKDFSTYDVIYHVAGIAHADTGHVNDDVKDMYYKVNTELAIKVAEKAKKEGVKQFIFMSSMIIYSGCKEKVITKSTEPKPLNFYGDSKLQADIGIRELEDDKFKVVIIRPPMIYGKDSKGNYPKLAKLACKVPFFPEIKNKRSMLHIDNLCELIKLIIDNDENGVFFPQNSEYVCTTTLVKEVAKNHNKKMIIIPFTGGIIRMLSFIPGQIGALVEKVSGDLIYELKMSEYKENYRVCDFSESIRKTEK